MILYVKELLSNIPQQIQDNDEPERMVRKTE